MESRHKRQPGGFRIYLALACSFLISLPSLAQYRYVKAFPYDDFQPPRSSGCQGIAVDHEGKVWIQPYDATVDVWDESIQDFIHAHTIYVFHANGTPADFSPLTSIEVEGTRHYFTRSARGLATDKSGNILASFHDKLYRIDSRTGVGRGVITPIKDDAVAAPAVDTAGNIYVNFVNKGSGPIFIIDDVTFSIIQEIDIGKMPWSRGLVPSVDGRHIYFSGFDDRQVYHFQSENGPGSPYSSVDTIFQGLSAESFGRHPRTGRIWLSSGSGYDPPNVHMWVRSSYVSHTWYEFDLQSRMLTDSLTWHNVTDSYAQRPRAIAFSPTGDTVYVGVYVHLTALNPMVQMFVTESLVPSISLVHPSGGLTLEGGYRDTIRWDSQLVSDVRIEYSLDGGADWTTIVSSIHSATGMLPWDVPNVSSSNLVIRITDIDHPNVFTSNVDNETRAAALPMTIAMRFWKSPWFIVSALIVLMMVSSSLAWFQRKRKLHQHLHITRLQFESQDAERKRLAAELHDGLGQDLLIVSHQVRQSLAFGDDARRELLEANRLLTDAIQSVRDLSSNLHPHQLDRLGFGAALESMTETVSRTTGIHIDRRADDIDELLTKETEVQFYRIIQEALSNIVRHAEATNVTVEIWRGPERIELAIVDDGKGFELPKTGAERAPYNANRDTIGFGLSSMTERSKIIGGHCKVSSSPGKGTSIRVTFPIRTKTV